MAKKPKVEEKEPEPSTELVTTMPQELVMTDELAKELMANEGAGISTKSEDNLIPIVTLLQDLSPQVKERNPEYVPGAKAGDFLIKGLGLLMTADTGFRFQPCFFKTAVNEWVPRNEGGGGGAGFVASYDVMPPGAVQVLNDKGKKVWRSAEGNDLVDTRYHSGFLEFESLRIPAVLAFSSTGHNVSKGWMMQMNNDFYPINGVMRKPPSWFRSYQVKSRLKQKNSQEWFLADISDRQWVQSVEQRTQGKLLYDAFMVGDKTVDHSSATDGQVEGEDAPF